MPGFEYSWNECVRKFIGICTKKAQRTDYYDLSKPEIRDQLLAAGFVAQVLKE